MDASPRSIAVLRLSALGDVVMTLPLLRTLQKAFPAAPEHLIDGFLRFATYVGAREHVLDWDLPLRKDDERALRLITVDAVVDKIERLFEHRGFKPQATS